MKVLRDLTLLCTLLLGMLWLATDSKTEAVGGFRSELTSIQNAAPQASAALLPTCTSLQSGLPLSQSLLNNTPPFLPLHDPWSMANVARPLSAAQQTATRCPALAQKRLILFPFHEFS